MKYTVEADIWALGCLLWELVTGAKAFRRDTDVFRHYRNGTPHSLPDLCEDVGGSRMVALIHRLLDLDEGSRPSATDFVVQLQSLASVSDSWEPVMEPVAPNRTMEAEDSSSLTVGSIREHRNRNTPLIQITVAPESDSPSHPSPRSFDSPGKDEPESAPPFEEQQPNGESSISIEANQHKSESANLSEPPKSPPFTSYEEEVRLSSADAHEAGITQNPGNEMETSTANAQTGGPTLGSIRKRRKIYVLERWFRKLTKKN